MSRKTLRSLSFLAFIIILSSIPVTLSLTLTGNVLQDLVAMDGDFSTEAIGWSASKLYDSNTLISNLCDDTPLLGGPSVLGSPTSQTGEFFSRTYTGLPPHDLINFRFEFWAIDGWLGSTNGDTFQIAFDSNAFNGWSFSAGDTVKPNRCGILNQFDVPGVIIEGNVTHNSSSLVFKVISKITQESGLASFGFRGIQFVFSVTGSGSTVKSICGRSPTVLPDSRKCSCMLENQFETPVGSGNCVACDPSCKTCSGTNANQCLSCSSDKYKIGGYCYLCDTTCLTCDGSGPNRCTSCKPGTYQNGVQCPICHPSCVTCNGGTDSNCLTCKPGRYPSGTQCPTCHPSCETCNGGLSTQCITCPSGSYLINGNTCITSCNSPMIKSTSGSAPTCISPCTDPNQYAYWDGTCSSTCDSPLTVVTIGTYKLCTYTCSLGEYLYWDKSCKSSCTPPLEVTKQKTKNFCTYKCTANNYLYFNGSCISTCPFPLKTRVESDGKQYCDYPCTSSEYLLWDQTCVSNCYLPFREKTESGKKYCNLPCSSSQLTYWNSSCSSDPCSPPLTLKTVGASPYQRQVCDLVCASNEYLRWTGICVTTCNLPLKISKSNGKYYCNPPCDSAKPYYFNDLGICGVNCASPRSINTTGLYPICNPAPTADEGGSLLFYILNAPVKPNEYTVVVTSNSMKYLHYLDMPMPERFEKLANSSGKSFLSPRFGFSVPSDFTSRRLLATFTKYPIPAVFERNGLHSSFLVNFWDGLFTLAVILVIAVTLTVIERILRRTNLRTVHSIVERLMVMAGCNYLLLVFISSIDEIILYSAIEISTFSHSFLKSTSAIISFAISVLMLLTAIAIIVFTIWLVVNATKMEAYDYNEKTVEDYTNYVIKWRFCQVLIRGFKSNSMINKLFFPLYILRINLPVILTAFLYQYPLILAIVQLVINIAIVAFILIKRPLNKKVNLVQLIITEIITLIMNIFVLVLVIMVVYDLGSSSSAVTSIGDVIIIATSILEVLRLLFLVIKAKIEIDAIKLILKKSPHKGKAVYVNLLSVLAQQTGMGFEEVIDEMSLPDAENKYRGMLARPFATEKAAQARNKNVFGSEIVNDSEPMLRKAESMPGTPLRAESPFTNSVVLTNNEIQLSNIIQPEPTQLKTRVKDIMNNIKLKKSNKSTPPLEELSPAFSIDVSDNSPGLGGTVLLTKNSSMEKSPPRRVRGGFFTHDVTAEAENAGLSKEKTNMYPVPFSVDEQE